MTTELLQGFYLGDYLIQPLTGQVTGRNGSSHLPPKAVETLLCLAERPTDIVDRETLLNEAWGVGHGSQESLSHAISEIRHALGDHHDNPTFIQTLPKRGYRLLVTPEPADEHTESIVAGSDGGRLADLNLFENLNRRGVLETAIAYLVLGWLLIQIADIVFDRLLLPDWAATFVTVLVIAGFPIALVLSWFLDFRDGRAVLDELSPADARKRRFGRTYMSVVGALGIAAIGVYIYDETIGLPKAPIVGEITEAYYEPPPIVENSFAVLPFMNIDGSDETQIFANGLVEDVITQLARVPGLRVSARGDSFSLAPNSASKDVRDRLRVEQYLEGSVEMAGDKMRVTVQMIDSETGFHVLGRSFPGPRENFFKVRDEITGLIVANVRVALPSDLQLTSFAAIEDPSLDAYLLYRRGIEATRAPWSIETVETALGWFDASLAVDPDYAAAHAGRCFVFAEGYKEVDDTAFIDRAESACAEALALNPNLDIVHSALGQLYTLTGRYDQAETAFGDALQIDPSNSRAIIGLGEVYLATNRPDDAEASFRQALGLYPGNWSAYNRYGNFLFRQGRYEEAAVQYEYVAAIDRDNMNAYSNLGAAYMLAANFQSSLTAFEHSLEIKPKKTTYSNLGLLHYYLGNLDESIASHRKAIELEPNDYLAWSNLGDALSIDGRETEAESTFRRAWELAMTTLAANPNSPYTMMDLAWINAMLGEHAAASDWIDRANDLAPDDPYTHYYHGLVLYRADDFDGAIREFSDAVERGYSRKLLAAEPRLEPLKSDTRFVRILTES